jgi:CHASE3 domain sensor protein
VSPRYAPDFNLPIIENKPDIDHILKVLLPVAYALGAALVLLIGLLIFGYRTRPKDKTQRDRDSKLHFRHVLFVVWFVGMRLLKSFLLTFSLFFILFSAIHHSNINTLRRYPEFRDRRQGIEKNLMAIMDEHKVQELNRQLGLLNEGKTMCDEKLREADAMIDTYFNEMRKRLIDDMKQKSIIYAAYKTMEKKITTAKDKFEHAREHFNRALRTATNEINYRIQHIRENIESHFWMDAAKVMYHVVDGVARFFGGGLEPFIKWVNLDVSFPSISFNLGSFQVFFDDFATKFKKPDFEFTLTFNASNWRGRLPSPNLSFNLKELRLPPLNISSPVSSERAKELLALDWVVALVKSGVLAGILVALDVTWFVFRHSRTYQSAVVLLHGFPVVYELKDVVKDNEKKKKASNDDLSNYGTLRSEAEMSESLSVNSENSLKITKGKTKMKFINTEPRRKEKSYESINQMEEYTIDMNDDPYKGSDMIDGQKDNEASMPGNMTKYGMIGVDYLNKGLFLVYGILKRINYEASLVLHLFLS